LESPPKKKRRIAALMLEQHMIPENPYQSPMPMHTVVTSIPGIRSRSRVAFLSQACCTVASVLIGMSESYHWLSWARVLIPLNLLLLPAAIAFPVAVLMFSVKDHASPWRTIFGVVLSVVLSIASFFAILPLIC
jgi:hypothetical protein